MKPRSKSITKKNRHNQSYFQAIYLATVLLTGSTIGWHYPVWATPVPDYGDAPDTYGTDSIAGNSSNGTDPVGPSHVIDNKTYLGTQVSVDDGITLSPLYAGNTNYSIPMPGLKVNTPGNATLHAWIDFNQNGKFEPSEYAPPVPIVNGQPQTFLNWAGLSPIPPSGTMWARFRISTDSSINANTPGGPAVDGEVEDYAITIQSLPISPASGQLTCLNLSTVKTSPSQYPYVYPLDPSGPATLPLGGVQISTTGNGPFQSYAPPAAAGKSFLYNGATIALQGNGAYLDIIPSPIDRVLGINFGASANTLRQGSSTYEHIIGIAGLGGNLAEYGTITSNTLLTKIGYLNVFNTGAENVLNGVTNPPVGATGTVITTPNPANSTGYTFYKIGDNISSASLDIIPILCEAA